MAKTYSYFEHSQENMSSGVNCYTRKYLQLSPKSIYCFVLHTGINAAYYIQIYFLTFLKLKLIFLMIQKLKFVRTLIMKMEDRIKSLRNQLDEIDNEIVKMLERRFEVSTTIIKLKKNNNVSVYNPEREKEIYNKILSVSRNFMKDSALRAIYERILDESRRTGSE